MIHVIFDRPESKLHVWDAGSIQQGVDGTQKFIFRAENDTWADTAELPYGHDCPMPPGHYVLTKIDHFNPPVVSEGFGQIYVEDMSESTAELLIKANRATLVSPATTPLSRAMLNIGGTVASIGGFTLWNRAEIMLHGGGSNAPEPFADEQMLCKTEGCGRMYNSNWKTLAAYLEPLFASETIVLSVIGAPVALAC